MFIVPPAFLHNFDQGLLAAQPTASSQQLDYVGSAAESTGIKSKVVYFGFIMCIVNM